MLSTFESLVVAWLDSGEIDAILKHEISQLGSAKSEISTRAKKSAATSPNSPQSPAPAHATVNLGPANREQLDCLDVNEEEYDCGPAEDRQRNYSRVYGNKNALAALILVLRCGV
jgi:hypothetical protein